MNNENNVSTSVVILCRFCFRFIVSLREVNNSEKIAKVSLLGQNDKNTLVSGNKSDEKNLHPNGTKKILIELF